MRLTPTRLSLHLWLLLAALVLTAAIYWPGLSGGFLFDDYPNIIDNQGVQPKHAGIATLVNAALSSPSSEFKRPLASLSFALNYLASGLDPFWMKLTNLVIHLLNGLAVFLLARVLLRCDVQEPFAAISSKSAILAQQEKDDTKADSPEKNTLRDIKFHAGIVSVLIAAGWMLLPINLTSVLYVVQRMESIANLFVLLGLLGYVTGRLNMLATQRAANASGQRGKEHYWGFSLCVSSLIFGTAIGVLAKETAVMLPLYAVLIEWLIFDFRNTNIGRDRRIIGLFLLLLAAPLVLGLVWLLPGVLNQAAWDTRDFTLGTRLLSESRIVSSYASWTLLPTPDPLSFYHDNFVISTGFLKPWTTLLGIVFIAFLVALIWWARRRQRLVALGLALFLGCQLLTGTILPLELVYEHRNYFASFGLLLAVIPLLAAQGPRVKANNIGMSHSGSSAINVGLPMPLARYVLFACLMLRWTTLTYLTSCAWGNPLRLAQELATRAPDSPRAQYELGRTYIVYSHYDPTSLFTKLAYGPLERSAALPKSSILPEQALIFMNSRMHLPLKDAWWNSMLAKLKRRKSTVQDESSLGALTQCERDRQCELPKRLMTQAYLAALSHPNPSARLLAMYGDYAWNVLDDHELGERVTVNAVTVAPSEPAYRITLVRMLAAQGRTEDAKAALEGLQRLDVGGRLETNIKQLQQLQGMQ